MPKTDRRILYILKTCLAMLMFLMLGTVTFLMIPFGIVYAQGGSTGADGALVVTNTVYVDTARYAMTQTVPAGGTAIPYDTGVNILPGDELLIITMQGPTTTVVGTYETVTVSAVNSATLTLDTPLINAYDGSVFKVMVQRVPNYTDVTVENGGVLTAHPWDGNTGGVVFLRALTVTVNSGGSIDVSGIGYRGVSHNATYRNTTGTQGEGVMGVGSISSTANNTGGGGGAGRQDAAGGGGGGYGSVGATGQASGSHTGGAGGIATGNAELSHLYLGGAGGEGGADEDGIYPGYGGNGGGILVLFANNIIALGNVSANGQKGGNANQGGGCGMGGGGGGSGGTILLSATEINTTGNIQAIGGGSGQRGETTYWHCGGAGGVGGDGRIELDYNIFSGSTTPMYYQGFPPSENDLYITLSGTLEISQGSSFKRTIRIENNSTITASNVVVTYTIPSSTTFDTASLTPAQQTGQSIIWNVGDLASREGVTITLTDTVSSMVEVTTSFSETGTVNSDLTEVNLENNTSVITSSIIPAPVAELALIPIDGDNVDMLTPFSMVVVAYDQYNNIATGYTGVVTLTTTDDWGTSPSHQFSSGDQGVFDFSGLLLRNAGTQTITATDGVLVATRVMTVDDNVVVDTSMTWNETDITLNSLVVTGTGTILTLAGSTTITAGNIIVGNGAKISADGEGYGPGIGYNGQNPGASRGGHHGGRGGGSSWAPYGSVYQPRTKGSGGGNGPMTSFGLPQGGRGGGSIHLIATNLVEIDGTLSAEGQIGTSKWTYGGGGGAGGSIWIETNIFTGTGVISTKGGRGL